MSTATIARTGAATNLGDSGLPRSIEDLLDAATEQGAITFGQVRRALDEANVGPADAKKVLRLISERGIQIGADAPGTTTPAASSNTIDEDDVVDTWDHEVPTTDLVRVYLTDIGRVALLNAEQEVDLAKRIEAGRFAAEKLRQIDAGEASKVKPRLRKDLELIAVDGTRARNHLLEANLRLVVSLAKRYQGKGLTLLDLIQE